MYPHHLDVAIRIEMAQARAAELRDAWQEANSGPMNSAEVALGTQFGLVRVVREATGRRLIGLGNRVLPTNAEPCA
jgi:hypothetical protein